MLETSVDLLSRTGAQEGEERGWAGRRRVASDVAIWWDDSLRILL